MSWVQRAWTEVRVLLSTGRLKNPLWLILPSPVNEGVVIVFSSRDCCKNRLRGYRWRCLVCARAH